MDAKPTAVTHPGRKLSRNSGDGMLLAAATAPSRTPEPRPSSAGAFHVSEPFCSAGVEAAHKKRRLPSSLAPGSPLRRGSFCSARNRSSAQPLLAVPAAGFPFQWSALLRQRRHGILALASPGLFLCRTQPQWSRVLDAAFCSRMMPVCPVHSTPIALGAGVMAPVGSNWPGLFRRPQSRHLLLVHEAALAHTHLPPERGPGSMAPVGSLAGAFSCPLITVDFRI
jgi:hypothetical protein